MTLLEVRNIIKNVCLNNEFVEYFEFGEPSEILQKPSINYPATFLEIPSVEHNEVITIYNFGIIVCDRVIEGMSNFDYILTKTQQIGETILKQLSLTLGKQYNPFVFNAVPITDGLTDRVYGWRFEFTLKIKNDQIGCKITNLINSISTIPVSVVLNSIINVYDEITDYTFDVQDINNGLTVEWSLDNFVTIAGTGNTYTYNNNNYNDDTIIYVRTSNGVNTSNVTTHKIVKNITPPLTPIQVTANNLQFDWKLGTQNFTLSVNENIPTGLTVEWSDDNFVTVLSQGETLQDTIDTSLVSSKLYYVRTNNSVTTSSVSTVTVSRKNFSLQKAWFFDRVNDNVTMLYDPSNPVYDFGTGDFTVSLWYKVTTTGVSHSIFNTYSATNTGIFFLHNPNGSGAWALRNDGPGQGGVQQFNVSPGLLPFNQIINLILVRNGVNRTNWRIFVNGVNTNTATGIITTQVNLINQGNINLGIIPGANRLGGQMAHFQMFNRALTDAECQQIYNAGAGNYPPPSTLPNLVVYHTLQKRVGSIVQPITPSEISETMSYGIGINYTADPIVNF
jgi:hypothetical protein